MEKKKFQKLSIAALIISLIPLATFVPVLLHLSLPDSVRTVLSGINICCVLPGLVLSVICVRNRDSRSIINITATVVSSFWIMLMSGMVLLSLFVSFVQCRQPFDFPFKLFCYLVITQHIVSGQIQS